MRIFYSVLILVISLTILLLIFAHQTVMNVAEMIQLVLLKIYSPFIYQSIFVKLVYIKKSGSKVLYERHDHITKLSLRRSKKFKETQIQVTGTISKKNASSINSSYLFPSKNTAVFHCYFDEDNIIEKQHYAGGVLMLKNSFLNKTEDWQFWTEHFCKLYRLDVVLPQGKGRITTKLLKKTIKKEEMSETVLSEESSGWEIVSSPAFMTRKVGNQFIITTRIVNVLPQIRYKLEWTFQD